MTTRSSDSFAVTFALVVTLAGCDNDPVAQGKADAARIIATCKTLAASSCLAKNKDHKGGSLSIIDFCETITADEAEACVNAALYRGGRL